MCSSSPIIWPPRLLLTLQKHIETVENAENPAIPPMDNNLKTICIFFDNCHSALADRLAQKGFDYDLTDYCIHFLCEILEEACMQTFLLPRERRIITSMLRHKVRKTAVAPRSKVTTEQTSRKVPKMEVDAVETRGEGRLFTSLLSLEYLLRLFFTLPPVLEHYDKLGASVMPPYAKRPIWEFVNECLNLLNNIPDAFSPISSYIPLKK
ncbi:unnamed protein product [Phytomonas sp. Hart1]|nr:unnamed protein product [Phytomonas sp. Hart1]|eukprot:CCW67243.1 unnamed protein product [Phytomonas sp. isolate Hart1]